MPSPFDITVASNTVTLDNNRTGVASFTVKNNTRRRVQATARVATTPPDGAKWLTFLPPEGGATSSDPANVRDFPIDGTQNIQINIAVPMDAAPAAYTMKLTVTDEVNPDDNFTESPDVVFTVREIPKPEPRPFPVWIIPAIIIAVLVVVAIIAVAITSSNNGDAAATATKQTEIAAARQTADMQTQNAVGTQNAIGTQNAAATLSAANMTATQQTALNVFLGDWVPVNTSGTQTVESMKISDAGNGKVNITYTSRCPPAGNICTSTPSSFAINGIPFTPGHLAASISNTTFQITPANGGQLVILVTTGSFPTSQAMKRSSGRLTIDLGDVLIATFTLNNSQFNQFRSFTADTPTPAP